MSVDKTNPARLVFCNTCKHQAGSGNDYPCNICGNPMGDMYESALPIEPKKPRLFIACKHCNGMGEIEVKS